MSEPRNSFFTEQFFSSPTSSTIEEVEKVGEDNQKAAFPEDILPTVEDATRDLKLFLLTEKGKLFKATVEGLLEKFIAWCNQKKIAIKEDDIASFRSKFDETKDLGTAAFDLYQEGIPAFSAVLGSLENPSIAYLAKFEAMTYLAARIGQCAPGVNRYFLEMKANLSTDLQIILRTLRRDLATTAINSILPKYATELGFFPGNDVHYVDALINFNSFYKEIGVEFVNDAFKPNWKNTPVLDDLIQESRRVSLVAISPEKVIEQILSRKNITQFSNLITDLQRGYTPQMDYGQAMQKLKEANDSLEKELTIFGSNPKEYNLYRLIDADAVEDGKFLLKPDFALQLTILLLHGLIHSGFVREDALHVKELTVGEKTVLLYFFPNQGLNFAYILEKDVRIPLLTYCIDHHAENFIALLENAVPEINTNLEQHLFLTILKLDLQHLAKQLPGMRDELIAKWSITFQSMGLSDQSTLFVERLLYSLDHHASTEEKSDFIRDESIRNYIILQLTMAAWARIFSALPKQDHCLMVLDNDFNKFIEDKIKKEGSMKFIKMLKVFSKEAQLTFLNYLTNDFLIKNIIYGNDFRENEFYFKLQLLTMALFPDHRDIFIKRMRGDDFMVKIIFDNLVAKPEATQRLFKDFPPENRLEKIIQPLGTAKIHTLLKCKNDMWLDLLMVFSAKEKTDFLRLIFQPENKNLQSTVLLNINQNTGFYDLTNFFDQVPQEFHFLILLLARKNILQSEIDLFDVLGNDNLHLIVKNLSGTDFERFLDMYVDSIQRLAMVLSLPESDKINADKLISKSLSFTQDLSDLSWLLPHMPTEKRLEFIEKIYAEKKSLINIDTSVDDIQQILDDLDDCQAETLVFLKMVKHDTAPAAIKKAVFSDLNFESMIMILSTVPTTERKEVLSIFDFPSTLDEDPLADHISWISGFISLFPKQDCYFILNKISSVLKEIIKKGSELDRALQGLDEETIDDFLKEYARTLETDKLALYADSIYYPALNKYAQKSPVSFCEGSFLFSSNKRRGGDEEDGANKKLKPIVSNVGKTL